MDRELERMLSCPFCRSGRRMLVEGRKEGFFRCLTCGKGFFLPSAARGDPIHNVLDRVMP